MSQGSNLPIGHQAVELELELQESLLSPSSDAHIEQGQRSAMANKFTKSDVRKTDGLAGMVALGSISFTALMTWIVVLTREPATLGWFAFHPLLQTLSLVFFAYGIVTLQTTSQVNPKAKAAGLVRHQGVIIGLAVPAILVGSWAVWHNKNLRGAQHYTTWHGTFGSLTLLWMIVQAFVGAGSVWFNGKLFGGGAKAKALWKYHRISGYVLFPMLLFTAHLGGAWSTWAEQNTAWIVRFLAFTVSPILVLAALYARARLSKMKFW